MLLLMWPLSLLLLRIEALEQLLLIVLLMALILSQALALVLESMMSLWLML